MKPDIILHIGLSKTGTSSIQRVLGARRAELLKVGICYPSAPGWANHGMLPASLVPLDRLGHFHPNLWEGMGPEARLAKFRREFADEMARLPPDIRLVVLSAEQCSGLLDTPARIAALRDLFAPYGSSVHVVVYLRRQDGHFASGYTQALRVAHISAPTLPRGGPAQMPQYDYAALLDQWAGVFGEAAIVPRIFERKALLNQDVVDDFLALCRIPLMVPADDPDRQSNLSLTPGAIDLVRAMGTHLAALPAGLTAASPLWRRFVTTVSDALPGPGWKPPAAEAAAFLGRFAAVNEAVRQRWFPDRPSLFAEMPDASAGAAPPAPPPPVDSQAALEAACTLLAHEMQATAQREAQQFALTGRLHERLGEAKPALNAYRAAIRAVPDHPVAQQRLAEIALAAGDLATARAHLAVLQAAHPGHELTQRVARLVDKAGR